MNIKARILFLLLLYLCRKKMSYNLENARESPSGSLSLNVIASQVPRETDEFSLYDIAVVQYATPSP